MRKIRGLRRYYMNLPVQNELDKLTSLNFSRTNVWFDNWHYHFDNYGFGNKSFKSRKPHLDKMIRHFDLFQIEMSKIQSDYQLYMVILDFSSNYDALYLHTENPNNSKFPWKYSEGNFNLQEKSNLSNPSLIEYLNKIEGFELVYGSGEESFCVLYKKNVGTSPL
jgi:hypothetical protein